MNPSIRASAREGIPFLNQEDVSLEESSQPLRGNFYKRQVKDITDTVEERSVRTRMTEMHRFSPGAGGLFHDDTDEGEESSGSSLEGVRHEVEILMSPKKEPTPLNEERCLHQEILPLALELEEEISSQAPTAIDSEEDLGTVATEIEEEDDFDNFSTASTEVFSEEVDTGSWDTFEEEDASVSQRCSLPVLKGGSVFTDLQVEDITDVTLNTFLESKQIERSSHHSKKGSTAFIYPATVEGDPNYLYKLSVPKGLPKQEQEKFWREGAFAATGIDPLPHLSIPLFFRVKTVDPQRGEKVMFVPQNQVKIFGKSLPKGTRVAILGQLEKKAPGETLEAFLEKEPSFFKPGREAFKKVALALHDFLKAARPLNFIHRDLSLSNIMYDPSSGKVTIIDTGDSIRLSKRGEAEDPSKDAPNPATTNRYAGSTFFMAPAVVQEQPYGAEVDAASVAFALLRCVNPSEFEGFCEQRFSEREEGSKLQDTILAKAAPADFLKIYLEKLGPKSETAKILEEEPLVQEIIDLAFQASAPGVAGEAAFEKLEKHSYFAKESRV